MRRSEKRAARGCLLGRLGAIVLAGSLIGLSRPAAAQQRIVRPEDFQRNLVPQEPRNRAEPARLPEPEVKVADDTTVLVESLKGVRFLRSPDDVAEKAAEEGVTFKDVKLPDAPEFRKTIEAYLGKPVTMKSISLMVRDTILYYRAQGRPVVDVIVPQQEITTGVVQLVVVEAVVGEIKIEGLRWFTEKQTRRQVHLQPGDAIVAADLLDDVNHINRNPFRFVRPVLTPGKDFGTTDVLLEGKDRFPMRFYVGADDTGSRATGLERYFAGVNMGNLWNAGHEAGYQYTTNRHFNDFGIHSAYYRIPLPNRDTLAFYGNIADYHIDHGGTELDSTNWMTHFRYISPLPSRPNLRHEIEFGFDFRRYDNDFQVGGATAYDDYIDVAQFAFQYGGRSKDRCGDTSFVINGYWSPCSDLLTNHQNRERYEEVRAGASPTYVYGHASVERLWILPKDWSLFNRLTGQAANRRLPPSEQLGLGGYNTVRGFDEREVNSDNGAMATVELRTPQCDLGIKDKYNIPSYVQFLLFCDYGYARNRGHGPLEYKTETLCSVGAGVRVRISDNAHIRVDYGHKLEDVHGSQSGDGRFHIFLLLAY